VPTCFLGWLPEWKLSHTVDKREREEEQKKISEIDLATSLVAAVAVPLTLVLASLGRISTSSNGSQAGMTDHYFRTMGLILLILVITVMIVSQ
jgi:hypothetical protein